MEKQSLEQLKGALENLIHQIENHQQNRNKIANVSKLVKSLNAFNEWQYNEETSEFLNLITGAICDPNGLGKLNLMLKNAKIPPKYYDIFYGMLYGGGEEEFVCIDCGAHCGLISDIILHCGGKSYVFEPNLYLNYFLNRKYKNNPNAILYQKAVDSKAYKTNFLMFENRMLSQGNRICSSKQDDKTTQSYEVEVIDLIDFIENEILKHHSQIYFLKLDVEGVEFEILERLIATKLYQKIRFIACEIHEYMFEDGETKLSSIQKQIKEQKIENIFLDWV
ncbi:FkbM family methyltransferase [Campylobacter cuniculorum]|uniref:Methyltransferase FkbM domain-containing protein n=2 Tax=Campylobacter cuniculorum TaxID=374106 RepID=A0A1W6BXJ8_9BACT|nr:FkbM family methyltransferase [Campylobacter cuniculorum]ARJ56750.1 hypothetical protein, putative methyltransferase [Campylobacter cuniculorum DSM 23162 = LMG 24588]QOR04219.1 FkbM family methyltransferase [Campylobacter cuniculorum]